MDKKQKALFVSFLGYALVILLAFIAYWFDSESIKNNNPLQNFYWFANGVIATSVFFTILTKRLNKIKEDELNGTDGITHP